MCETPLSLASRSFIRDFLSNRVPRYLILVATATGGLLSASEQETKSAPDESAKQQNLEFCAAICAHHISSGLWVVGRTYERTPEEVVAEDIAPFPYFGWEPDFQYKVDEENHIVTVTPPGAPSRSARYLGDQGSVILPRGEEDVHFTPVPVPRNLPDPTEQDWPMGDVGATTPLPEGVDGEAVNAALDWAMEQENLNTRAFVVAYDGKIVGERYAPGWTQDTPQISWSQGKSITATLIGILVQRGLLEIDQPAPIEEWQEDGDPRSQIRIRDLLQMSSGLDFENLGFGGDVLTAENEHMRVYFDSIDVFKHAISPPLEVPPGTRNSYLNCDPLTLGKIIRDTVEAQGEDYLTFPQRALFDRIGARSPVLETDAWGNFILSGYDYLSARDWVRFGQLYLQDGVWQGERILPEGWTEFVMTPAPADEKENYGGMFWLNRAPRMERVPKDAYWAAGFMGQVTMIIPSRKLVVVRMGPNPGDDVYTYLDETISRVLKAVP